MFPALASADLLGFGRRVGSEPLYFPAATGTVGIYPDCGDFRRRTSFVELLLHLHTFKHDACILLGITFKVPFL